MFYAFQDSALWVIIHFHSLAIWQGSVFTRIQFSTAKYKNEKLKKERIYIIYKAQLNKRCGMRVKQVRGYRCRSHNNDNFAIGYLSYFIFVRFPTKYYRNLPFYLLTVDYNIEGKKKPLRILTINIHKFISLGEIFYDDWPYFLNLFSMFFLSKHQTLDFSILISTKSSTKAFQSIYLFIHLIF
jgi:hypothetical protein